MDSEHIRVGSFTAKGQSHWGVITDGGAIAAQSLYSQFPTLLDFIKGGSDWNDLAPLALSAVAHKEFSYDIPVHAPGKIICVGVNFPDRNAEYKDGSDTPKFMSLFPRFASSFTAHNAPLIRPPENHTLDYEGEMAVVIGRGGRRIKAKDAHGHIAALSICNEGTIRDWVRHAKFNVTQGKNWDNSGAIGPWLVPFVSPEQIENTEITTRVNGDIRQQDNTSRMTFPIRQQIEYISTFTTLNVGDIIITGTPTGAGARMDPPQYLAPGDVVEVEVSGIGTLRNTVEDEA